MGSNVCFAAAKVEGIIIMKQL